MKLDTKFASDFVSSFMAIFQMLPGQHQLFYKNILRIKFVEDVARMGRGEMHQHLS
jgi:hypothetical protein